MPDLLIYGDTIRSPELRHEVPVPVPDAFIYAEKDGARYVFVGSLEIPRIEGLNGIVTVPLEDLGIDELYCARPPLVRGRARAGSARVPKDRRGGAR